MHALTHVCLSGNTADSLAADSLTADSLTAQWFTPCLSI